MNIEWKNATGVLDYPTLHINGMQVGWITPFGDGARGVIAPKLREAMKGPPVIIIHRTQEEAKAELEGVCVAIMIGQSYGA